MQQGCQKYQQRFLSLCVAFDATVEPVSMHYRLLCTISIVRGADTSVHKSMNCQGALLVLVFDLRHAHPAGRDATKACPFTLKNAVCDLHCVADLFTY